MVKDLCNSDKEAKYRDVLGAASLGEKGTRRLMRQGMEAGFGWDIEALPMEIRSNGLTQPKSQPKLSDPTPAWLLLSPIMTE